MAGKLNRRDFLKGIGLAAASAGARMIPTLPVTDIPEALEGSEIVDGGVIPLDEYAGQLEIKLRPWVSFDGVECDCPLCQRLSGKSWVGSEGVI